VSHRAVDLKKHFYLEQKAGLAEHFWDFLDQNKLDSLYCLKHLAFYHSKNIMMVVLAFYLTVFTVGTVSTEFGNHWIEFMEWLSNQVNVKCNKDRLPARKSGSAGDLNYVPKQYLLTDNINIFESLNVSWFGHLKADVEFKKLFSQTDRQEQSHILLWSVKVDSWCTWRNVFSWRFLKFNNRLSSSLSEFTATAANLSRYHGSVGVKDHFTKVDRGNAFWIMRCGTYLQKVIIQLNNLKWWKRN